MNGKWLTLGVVGIFAALIALMRKYVGIALLMLVALFCTSYFKADIIQMMRESAQREEARQLRLEKSEEAARIERNRIDAERKKVEAEHEAKVTAELKQKAEQDAAATARVQALLKRRLAEEAAKRSEEEKLRQAANEAKYINESLQKAQREAWEAKQALALANQKANAEIKIAEIKIAEEKARIDAYDKYLRLVQATTANAGKTFKTAEERCQPVVSAMPDPSMYKLCLIWERNQISKGM